MKKKFADFSENKDIMINSFSKREMDQDAFFAVACASIVSINGEDKTFLDTGYKSVALYPREGNFIVRSYFNNNSELMGVGFEIPKSMKYNTKIPYIEDSLLEIVITDKKDVVFLNENELNEGFKANKIKTKDYDLAKRTADKIVNKYNNPEQIEAIRQISLKCLGE